jgi:hypothetical protein
MNLNEAIDRHTEWKVRLRNAISRNETVDADSIRRDDCCVLGKWLHGDGKTQHGAKQSFSELVVAHADFHTQAGAVADAVNARQYDEAQRLMGVWGEYLGTSVDVIDAITRLQKEIEPAPQSETTA